MARPLVTNRRLFGKYVALRSPNDNTVVGSGATPNSALKRARAKGEREPILLYVPKDAMTQIY